MRLQEEIKELEQRFAEAPDSRLFLPLADALKRAGELDRAAKLCREGLQRYPDFNSARILLGEALVELGELDEAGKVLEQAATLDSDNGRIMELLSAVGGNRGEGQKVEPAGGGEEDEQAGSDQPSGNQVIVDSPDDKPGEQEQDKGPAKFKSEAGEMFITHTLGDIYRMQGHELKALEVYRKLLDEGRGDPELKRKAEELAGKLAEGESVSKPDGPTAAVRDVHADVGDFEAPPTGEGPFEERIDAIFHFLLGDSPEHPETSAMAVAAGKDAEQGGNGDFVDMLEDWIVDLKQEM
jgi:tetratricopeptide (TPR) repeat protein